MAAGVSYIVTGLMPVEVSSERLRVGEPRSGMSARLTTELRVLALIRLGIGDKDRYMAAKLHKLQF